PRSQDRASYRALFVHDRGRLRSDPAGVLEPGAQRVSGDARRRAAARQHRRRRRLLSYLLQRQRSGHVRSGSAKAFPAVPHEFPVGHRTRHGDLVSHRAGARRRDRCLLASRRRHDDHGVAAQESGLGVARFRSRAALRLRTSRPRDRETPLQFLSMTDARVLSAQPLEDEIQTELSLRPKRLKEYIGQQKVKANLEISIASARKRHETLDHVLLLGPPGLGKTTLANILANEMEATIRTTSGPALEKPGDLVAIITNLESGELLFIDEIHRLPAPVEEVLYSAMEDFYVDVVIGQGPSARTLKVEVPRFTLIGATTRAGLLTSPLRARFGIVHRLDFYDGEALTIIVRRSADIPGIPTTA